MKIGISGNVGSFSEEAAVYYCQKHNIKNYKIIYLITVDKTLSFLIKNKINKAIFPIENSNGGIVYESVYAMAKYIFKIENMFEIDIRHCVLSLPNKNLKDIKKIVSHPQALKQCKMYLKMKWPKAEIVEWSDTAQAAKDLSNGKIDKNSAVIAPSKCAELYRLRILEEGVQDLKFNFTTFITAIK